MELLKNSKDKRARKLAKRRVRNNFLYYFNFTYYFYDYIQLGTLTRAKRKVEELNTILIESRRAH